MFFCFAFSSSSSCINNNLEILQNGKDNARQIYLIWPSRHALIGALGKIPPTTIEPKTARPHSLLSATDIIWSPKYIFSCELCLQDDAHCKVTRKCHEELEHSVENLRKGTSLGYRTTSSNMLFGRCLYKCDGEQYKYLSLLSPRRFIPPHLFLQLLQPSLISFS